MFAFHHRFFSRAPHASRQCTTKKEAALAGGFCEKTDLLFPTAEDHQCCCTKTGQRKGGGFGNITREAEAAPTSHIGCQHRTGRSSAAESLRLEQTRTTGSAGGGESRSR